MHRSRSSFVATASLSCCTKVVFWQRQGSNIESIGFGVAGLSLAIAWYSVARVKHDHPVDTIERLVRLRDAGVIDDEEFDASGARYSRGSGSAERF